MTAKDSPRRWGPLEIVLVFMVVALALLVVFLLVSGNRLSISVLLPATTSAPVLAAPPTQVPTVAPSLGQQVSSSSADEAQACPQARDLGPWAPNNGIGEDFEVTANETVSAGVVLGLWWPTGNTPWGKDEITSFLPTGLSIEVQDGAGRGFDYALGCSQGEIDAQMAEHMTQRGRDTSYHGFVDVDELIRLGLVVVRFDRRASGGS